MIDAKLALPDGPGPVFLRLADAVVDEIRRGRLRPGDPLPGTRRIAEQLGVHRNTVLAAWSELESQGWIASRPGTRTVIAALPERPPSGVDRRGKAAGFDVPWFEAAETAPEWPPGTLALAGGRPDRRQFPSADITRAWRAAVRVSHGKVLDYGAVEGHPRLRAALASVLNAERGLVLTADELLVTRGAQQALYLAAQTLLRPGDRVAVERFGYRPAWNVFRSAGAELVPIDVDHHGMVVEQVEAVASTLRAVYVTPHHQYPTMATLPASRRVALLAAAKRHRFAVIEDDYDNEFHYAGRPVLPLASLDRAGVVVYVGTLSKTLAPGLRLGYLVAPRAVLDAAAARRLVIDRQGDHAAELAVAMMIEDGAYGRHLRRMRKVYAGRQQVLAQALREELGDRVSFEVPMGGLALWLAVTGDAEGWAARALRRGVGVDTSLRYDLHQQTTGFFRAGFAWLNEEELRRAVRILAETADG